MIFVFIVFCSQQVIEPFPAISRMVEIIDESDWRGKRNGEATGE